MNERDREDREDQAAMKRWAEWALRDAAQQDSDRLRNQFKRLRATEPGLMQDEVAALPDGALAGLWKAICRRPAGLDSRVEAQEIQRLVEDELLRRVFGEKP